MWYPISLKIHNLFSYQDSTFSFIRGRMVPIYGSNQTDPKVLSNGSGKTSLLDVASIALTGSPLRNISKKSIVRRGCNSGSLEFFLKNDVLNQELLIKVFPDKVKTNRVEIWENNVLNTQLKDLNPKDSHKYILSLLDISQDDLLNYYLLGKDTYTSFFTTKDSEKKEVINRFSKANIVDPIDNFIKVDFEEVAKELGVIESKITARNAKIEVLEEQIQDLKLVDKNEIKQKAISALEERIVVISDTIEGAERIIASYEQSRLPLSQQLSTLEADKSITDRLTVLVTEIGKAIAAVQKEREIYSGIDQKYTVSIQSHEKDLELVEQNRLLAQEEKEEITDLISEIERHIADEIECPSCHHKFCFKDGEYNLEEAKKQLPELRETIKKLDSKLSEFKLSIESVKESKQLVLIAKKKDQDESIKKGKELNEALNALNTQESTVKKEKTAHQEKIDKLKLQIPKIDTDIKIKEENIKAFNKQLDELFDQIEVERERVEEDKVEPIMKQIEVLVKEIIELKEKQQELSTKKESYTTWKLRFKKFKSYLANNSISMIESLSNHYLQGMGTHLSVTIDGFREKADGTLKEEISAEVSCDGGVTSESFYEFSNGEKGKIDVAGILAMQKLINLNSKSGGLDLLWIDEIIDSIDRVALGELIKSLDKVNQTILLISHIDLPDTENAIKIEKKLGISNVIMN